MIPTFTRAMRYFITVTCLSPLRTGGAEGDTQEILRYLDGAPFLPGTSLAGAMKSWKENKALLGDETCESALIVSDVVFDGSEATLRPRLRMDGKNGTAAKKFDVAGLPSGVKGRFQLVWRGVDGEDAAAAAIEEYLSAIQSGAIALGAQKANGFGRVALEVRKRAYHLEDGADLDAWLLGDEVSDARPISLRPLGCEDAVFSVTALMPAMLVKASTGEGVGEMGVNAVQMRENGKIVIPGSSIKGALRAQLQRIAPHLGAEALVVRLLGRESKEGDNGIAGRLRFTDGTIQAAKTGVINRIRINRFTGGVMHRGLFSEESVSGRLTFEIRAPGDMPAGCGLMLFALRDFGLGLFELGSGSAVGRGHPERLQVQLRCGEKSASLTCEGGKIEISDPNGLIDCWQTALAKGDAE